MNDPMPFRLDRGLTQNELYWQDKNVLVTGGLGFIGTHLVNELTFKGANVMVADIKHPNWGVDLRYLNNCLYFAYKQDIIFNLAANVGGIDYNATHQAEMFYDNVIIASNMLEAAKRGMVSKYLCVSSACVYSNDVSQSTPENEGMLGNPEPTNYGYGWAKRIAELQAQIYYKESKLPVIIVRPYNCYGEGDHFGNKSHVIPSLIEKIYKATNTIEVWGTGKQTRSFIYVKDLVKGMMLAVQKGEYGEVYNLGSDEEVSIQELIDLLILLSGKQIKVKFTEELGGQQHRLPDITKALTKLGFMTNIPLVEGLKNVVKWYKEKERIE